MAEITVIIPMYNAGRKILRCLKSVAKQDFKDFEIIVIDDGSTDDSLSIASRVKLPNLRVIHKENSGVAYTRNYGIELATGRYIAFIDQDDFIAKDYLSSYYKAATSGAAGGDDSAGADIVVGGFERVSFTGKILRREVLKDSKWARYIVTAPWAHLYKRDFLISNDIEFLDSKIGEDVYFNLVAYQCTDKVVTLHDCGYKWYFNENSVSNSIQNTFDNKLDVLFLLDAIYEKVGCNDVFLQYYFLRYFCWYMLFSSRGSRKKDIVSEYNKCMDWIKEHVPNYRKNPYIGFKMPKGENPKLHAYVLGFYFLEKLGLVRGLLTLFGK
ncbi:MAG: glycosyltransferase [Eubacterium sp.]|nr:glycosyltransferase [Eubacterium sp.]